MVPRIRWRFLLVCLGLAVVALVATLVVSALLPAQDDGAEITGELNDFDEHAPATSLLVVLLLTPLQAAGEEYAFRGYLTQAFGGLFRQRVGRGRASSPPSCSRSRTAARTRRSSSTGSRSAWSPGCS